MSERGRGGGSRASLLYIPIKRVAPVTTRVPARNIEPVNSMCSSAFTQLADHKKKKPLQVSHPRRNIFKGSEVQGLVWDACVPGALPFSVFTAAVVCASLHPIEWQADHIDAPPSPQQSLISERAPALQRAANGGRGSGESLAASAL